MDVTSILLAGAALAVITFALRAAGPLIAERVEISASTQRAVDVGVLTLLSGVAVTSAAADGSTAAGFARVAGVAVAGLLAWRRAPLPVVIVAAGCVTAALRMGGID